MDKWAKRTDGQTQKVKVNYWSRTFSSRFDREAIRSHNTTTKQYLKTHGFFQLFGAVALCARDIDYLPPLPMHNFKVKGK